MTGSRTAASLLIDNLEYKETFWVASRKGGKSAGVKTGRVAAGNDLHHGFGRKSCGSESL
jgi:hypothetical protein